MYFDVKTTNLQEVLDVLSIRQNIGVTTLQKVLKHIPWVRALPKLGLSLTV